MEKTQRRRERDILRQQTARHQFRQHGIAERREVWYDGKTLTGCANDLHGPYLGRDGRVYWCKGAFAEQTYDLPGRSGWKTRASHVFRARDDASAGAST